MNQASKTQKTKILAFFFIAGSVAHAACTADDLSKDVERGYASCSEYNIDKTIFIRSTVTFDGRGARISGVGSYKQCDQFPSNKAVFWIESSNNLLKNFTIVQSPEGIHVVTGNNNVLENIKFEKVCEDAVTNGNNAANSAQKTTVRGCSFRNAEDKAIQSNGGTMLIEKNTFTDVARPLSSCGHNPDPGYHGPGKCPIRSDLYVQGNTFVRSNNYAIQAAGKYHSVVYSRKNTFKSTKAVNLRTQNNSEIFSNDEDCSKKSGKVNCNSSKVDPAFSKFINQ